MKLSTLLEDAVRQGASDIHLSAGLPPLARIHGKLRPMGTEVLDDAAVREGVRGIMNERQRAEYAAGGDVDFSFQVPDLARFRVNAYRQNRGAGAALRVISDTILTMADLGLGAVFEKVAALENGLAVVTGPTGSGKSTTLAALIDHINDRRSGHILTVEDPIEFVHAGKRCLVTQREVHRDVTSFAAALRSALREDPDVIMVGELRDLETIRLALTAAETGHLVFGTLHTTSAAQTVNRIIDVFPAAEKAMVRSMLAESLRAVIAQILLPKVGGGRVAAHEIMLGTPAIRAMIREDKVAQMQSAMQTGAAHGMQTLEQAMQKLAAAGQIERG